MKLAVWHWILFVAFYLVLGGCIFKYVNSTWTIYQSLFFAVTLVTTIGYGDVLETKTERCIIVMYALLGIPIYNQFSKHLRWYCEKKLLEIINGYIDANDVTSRSWFLKVIKLTIIAILPVLTVFILVPTVLISQFEDCDLGDSIYYVIGSLLSIGFRQMPIFENDQVPTNRIFGNIYKIVIIIWLIVIPNITKILSSLAKKLMANNTNL